MKYYIIIIILLIMIVLIIKTNLSEKSSGQHQKSKKNIYFGQTIDLDGNLVAKEYFKGFQLAFQSVNRKGGINGYIINIVLLNDKYNKDIALANANLLVDYYDVLALIGLFGTTTIVNVLDSVVIRKNIPLIAPFSGSSSLRNTFTKNLILTNGSNNEEFSLLFKLLKKKNIKNIGIIHQNDEYGYSYLTSFINQIIVRNEQLNILTAVSYKRESINLYQTYQDLFDIKKPYLINNKGEQKNIDKLEAVILFCTETQISNILGTLKKINPSLLIYYGFFIGDNKSNYKVVGNNTNNVYQSLLSYNIEKKFPIMYKKFLEEIEYHNLNPELDEITGISKINNFSSTLYQGFYSGLLIIEVLKSFKSLDNIKREDFINKFYEIKNFKIYDMNFGPFIINSNNVGINYSSINKIVNKELITIDELDLNKVLQEK